MDRLVAFIGEYVLWFYVAGAVGLLIAIAQVIRAQRDLKRALFGLELEMATARRTRSLRQAGLLLTLLLAVVLIQNWVVPSLPASGQAAPTPTPDLFATPPPTYTNQTPTATATLTATLALTVTLPAATPRLIQPAETEPPPEPTATATPEPGPPVNATCVLTSPADGSAVSGEVTFIGTAAGESFLFYKIEVYGPETGGNWASVLGDVVSTPVTDGVLGTANFGGWAPGGYSIRLVIVDTTYNEIAGCYLNLTVASP